MLRRSLKKRVARLLLRFSATGFGERVAEYVSVLNRLLHNDSGDIELNGENWLLQRLGTQELRVVLDVGANQGDWCARALRAAPAAQIHAFEPIPAVFARLEKALGNQPRATLVRAALTEPGSTSLRMWTAGEDGLMSSATAPARSNSEELLVDCMTGDDYLRSHSVTHVDLLKIDVEGHEMQVLRGFEDSFRSGCVDVVQFEFTLWTVIARQWLADYYEFFDRFGFAVGKLLPRRVAWKPYAPEDEQFFRCNFVAARWGTRSAELLGVEQSVTMTPEKRIPTKPEDAPMSYNADARVDSQS